MLKEIWQKIKRNHWLLMALCCLAPILIVFIVLPLFRGNNGSWIWLIILLCPLSHIFMMRGHGHDENCEKEKEEADKKQ